MSQPVKNDEFGMVFGTILLAKLYVHGALVLL